MFVAAAVSSSADSKLGGLFARLYFDDRDNLYPAIGAGIQYLVKPAERLVITMDLAEGKADNSGFYLRFGQAF
jgi:hypothetical protein